MLKPKRKLSKKELKQDKFVSSALQAKGYIEDNYRQVTTVVLVILAIVVAIMGYRYYHNQQVEKALTILGKAQLEYQNGNLPKAQSFLNRLIQNYGGTNASAQGEFLLANIYYQQNNFAEAKRLFNNFIDDYDESKILIASGYAGYAACLEHEEKYAEAAENYILAQKKAPDFVEAPNYLYLAAQNYINIGQYAEARRWLEKIREDYPDSPRSDDAIASLIQLEEKS